MRHGWRTYTQNIAEGTFAGARRGTVEVTIDVDALVLFFGARALRNKTRKARALGIVAKAHSVEEVTP